MMAANTRAAWRARQRELAVPAEASPSAAPLLFEALEQARDRLESIFEAVHPEPWTDEDMERITQAAWFGMQEADRALDAVRVYEADDVAAEGEP